MKNIVICVIVLFTNNINTIVKMFGFKFADIYQPSFWLTWIESTDIFTRRILISVHAKTENQNVIKDVGWDPKFSFIVIYWVSDLLNHY